MKDGRDIKLVVHSRLTHELHIDVGETAASLSPSRRSIVFPVPAHLVKGRKLDFRLGDGRRSDVYTVRVLRSSSLRRGLGASGSVASDEKRPLIARPSGAASTRARLWSSSSRPHQPLRLVHSRIDDDDNHDGGELHVLVFAARDPSTWLGSVPSSCSLSSLCLPGSHETLARYGWPFSQCQNTESTVAKQLEDGIRFMDIRLRPRGEKGKERLLAYHGSVDERIEFSAVLEQVWAFLEGPGKQETLVMSVKQEGGDQDTFINLLKTAYVDATPPPANDASPTAPRGRQRWFLENRVPTLGEVRGKIVLLSRFVIDPKFDFPGGISPPIWPDSYEGCFDYKLPTGQAVQTQDWYHIGSLSSIPRKFELIRDLMDQGGRDPSTLALDFCNGSSVPWALPPSVAKGWLDDGSIVQRCSTLLATRGVNPRLRDRVADIMAAASSSPHAHSGGEEKLNQALDGLMVTFAIDFYAEPAAASDLVPLLIEANFQ